MCGVEHPPLCHCLDALLLGLAKTGVTSISGFIPGFAPCVLVHHHEHIPSHPLHVGVAPRSLCWGWRMYVGRGGPCPEQPNHETAARKEVYGGVRSHRGPEDRVLLSFGYLGRITLGRSLSHWPCRSLGGWLRPEGSFRWWKLIGMTPHGHPGNMWQYQEFNWICRIPAQCLNQRVTLLEHVAFGPQRRADLEGHYKFPPVVCSNQPNWYFEHWKSGSSGVTGFLISFLDSNLVMVCGRLSLGLGKGSLICVCIRKWGGPRGSHLWRSDGQLVLIWRCFRRTSFWTDSVWPCGPNAGVFTGLKPIFQLNFSPKEIQSWHHSVMETKMREAGAIREFSTKACSGLN